MKGVNARETTYVQSKGCWLID